MRTKEYIYVLKDPEEQSLEDFARQHRNDYIFAFYTKEFNQDIFYPNYLAFDLREIEKENWRDSVDKTIQAHATHIEAGWKVVVYSSNFQV